MSDVVDLTEKLADTERVLEAVWDCEATNPSLFNQLNVASLLKRKKSLEAQLYALQSKNLTSGQPSGKAG